MWIAFSHIEIPQHHISSSLWSVRVDGARCTNNERCFVVCERDGVTKMGVAHFSILINAFTTAYTHTHTEAILARACVSVSTYSRISFLCSLRVTVAACARINGPKIVGRHRRYMPMDGLCAVLRCVDCLLYCHRDNHANEKINL